jgi:hypothetical protein
VHLFLVALGLDPDLLTTVLSELHSSATLFPLLDPGTVWSATPGFGVIAAGIHTAAAVAAPRTYVHDDGQVVTWYDGLPIDPTRCVVGHSAASLGAAWSGLADRLEGRYCAVRLQRTPLSMELLTDPLGVEQLYVHESARGTILSNNAGLIEGVIGSTGLDPLGVSTFLTLDFVGGDRTLQAGIRVVPGGQHWTWRAGDGEWQRRRYWAIPGRAGGVDRPVDGDMVRAVADGIAGISSVASELTGWVNAPLTGGKDSRALASVLVGSGVPARFWTKGDKDSLDVAIATELAGRLGVPHRVANRPTQVASDGDPTETIGRSWASLSRQFVSQTDGLASLIYLGNIHGQPSRIDRLEVTLAALAGESAREVFATADLLEPGATTGHLKRGVASILMTPPRGLVRGAAYHVASDHLGAVMDDARERGVRVTELANAFYLEERCRRWASMNPRELAQTEDKVLPFLSRPYVSAAMSMAPADRWRQRLHRSLIRAFTPDIENEPSPDIPWRGAFVLPTRSQRIRRELVTRLPVEVRRGLVGLREARRPPATPRARTTPYDEPAWIEANLATIRDVCLADPGADLWSFVDRHALERLLAPGTPAGQRRLQQLPLFATITITLADQLRRERRAARIA